MQFFEKKRKKRISLLFSISHLEKFYRAAGGFWFKLLLTKTCQLSWCAAVTDYKNLSLKFALPARLNTVELEFASKDLVNGY